ncbi:hypothetical protein SAMN05421749_102208 [Acinetobacter marinus]|uniref:Lipopolysaccharide biosynthesis protein n=1 Tax=Acinetobacter marinus TaxID=281375 RepID=A0A1G6HG97_9GAMM|nr:hypothetical protein [Acinetobacter marinus]SDB93262.1 hypothetical protein SAMN05421749_102208 [Acinetobacter marinus]
MRKLKIILAMPSHSNFAQPIQENLQHHDIDVSFIDCSPEYQINIKLNYLHKIYHFFHKYLFLDPTYKVKAKNKIKEKIIDDTIKRTMANRSVDFTLVIRPDLFSLQQLKMMKSATSDKLIGYQWNGLNRLPKTVQSINQFDQFYVFDPLDLSNDDYQKYHLQGTTNFYFDMYLPQPIAHEGVVAYFVGIHFDDRTATLEKCAQALLKQGILLDFNILYFKKNKITSNTYQCKTIKLITDSIKFDENIDRINQSDILVDVVNPIHHGLSFRTFEALYYQKKLITNNSTVKDYDFYHPNNILIWDGEDLSMLGEFLRLPYHHIDDSIRDKYSFKNWIKNILNLEPYQKILLPNAKI